MEEGLKRDFTRWKKLFQGSLAAAGRQTRGNERFSHTHTHTHTQGNFLPSQATSWCGRPNIPFGQSAPATTFRINARPFNAHFLHARTEKISRARAILHARSYSEECGARMHSHVLPFGPRAAPNAGRFLLGASRGLETLLFVII